VIPTFESMDEILNRVTIQRKSGHAYFILRHSRPIRSRHYRPSLGRHIGRQSVNTRSLYRSLSTNKYFLVLPHVMQSKTDWYSGPLAVDSGFQVLDPEIIVSGTMFPDSLSWIRDSNAQSAPLPMKGILEKPCTDSWICVVLFVIFPCQIVSWVHHVTGRNVLSVLYFPGWSHYSLPLVKGCSNFILRLYLARVSKCSKHAEGS